MYNINAVRGVAQFGRVLRSGRRGRRFKSCHLDQKSGVNQIHRRIFAAVVELADTRDLKSLGSNIVPVQVRSAALINARVYSRAFIF